MRPVNKKTGCKVDSKGDYIGRALMSSKTLATAFGAVMQRVAQFYAEEGKKVSPADVRAYSIVWIDTLRKQHPEIYGKYAQGVVYSVAHRVAGRLK